MTVLDCLQGLETALAFGWLDYKTVDAEHRRNIALAFDAVPLFQIELCRSGEWSESSHTVQFWVAADPVTTAIDPVDAGLPGSPTCRKILTTGSSASSTKTPVHAQSRRSGLSRWSGQSRRSASFSSGVLLRQKSSPDDVEAAVVSVDPVQELLMRRPSTPMLRRAVSRIHPSKLDGTKPAATPERPQDLHAFARWCQDDIGCRVVVRANFKKERGLPEGGSYGDIFTRWGMRQIDVPIPDGTPPAFGKCVNLAEEVTTCLLEDGVHIILCLFIHPIQLDSLRNSKSHASQATC